MCVTLDDGLNPAKEQYAGVVITQQVGEYRALITNCTMVCVYDALDLRKFVGV